jgi:hypothetical protein
MSAPVFAASSWRHVAGSPSRRPGNFLLRGQKKVTKEEALNRTRAPHARAAPCDSPLVSGKTRPAALSLLSLSPAPSIAPPARLTRGCTPCSSEQPMQRRSGDAMRDTWSLGWRELRESQQAWHHSTLAFAELTPTYPPQSVEASPQRRGIPDEPGVQPALTGVKRQCVVLVTRTAARAQRVASSRNTAECFRALLMATPQSSAVQGLFFGDFLLAPQKKVTPPPGGTPGTTLAATQKYRERT